VGNDGGGCHRTWRGGSRYELDSLDETLAVTPGPPTETCPDRRRKPPVIKGWKE